MSLAGLGVLLGLGATLVVGRVLAGFLYGVQPSDPIILWLAATALMLTAGIACVRPAWRASRTDPTTALRAD
jgi:ABC-type antimicrobial peptide transport system permease subunit